MPIRKVPKHSCDCWRLTSSLADEALPDHVCWQTAAATIYNGPPIPGAEVTPDLTWPVRHHAVGWWGQPSRQLTLVLREWAQEPSNRTLAKQLSESRDWWRAVSSISGEFVRWRRRNPAAPLIAWIDDTSQDWRYVALLRQHRLPPTPATCRFLRACAARRVDPRSEGGPHESRPDPDSWVELAGPLEFATGPVLEAATNVARKHRDWLRDKVGPHLLADRRAIHRAKPRAFQPMDVELDYVEEALASVPDFLRVNPDWASLSHGA